MKLKPNQSFTNLLLVTLGIIGTSGSLAYGGVVITVTESGGNVVYSTTGGTLNLSALTYDSSYMTIPRSGGSTFTVGSGYGDHFSGAIFGPSPSPTGTGISPTVALGDVIGLDYALPFTFGLVVRSPFLAPGATTGTLGSSSSTYAGKTLASMSLTPGTYTWTWGSGGTADSLTLDVVAVPEPSSMLLGLVGTGLFIRRRR